MKCCYSINPMFIVVSNLWLFYEIAGVGHPSANSLDFGFHLVGVIWIGRWAGERKERISEVTL